VKDDSGGNVGAAADTKTSKYKNQQGRGEHSSGVQMTHQGFLVLGARLGETWLISNL
jgi:hypothetical protein